MVVVEVLGWALRIVTAVIFIGMGVNHFRPRAARVMAKMIPPPIRFARGATPLRLVWFTGVCEVAGGVGILVPWTRFVAGVALVVFLVAVFPANAYAAGHPEVFKRAAVPFWPRFLMQLALIAVVVAAAGLPG